jgi:hypothetical protein
MDNPTVSPVPNTPLVTAGVEKQDTPRIDPPKAATARQPLDAFLDMVSRPNSSKNNGTFILDSQVDTHWSEMYIRVGLGDRFLTDYVLVFKKFREYAYDSGQLNALHSSDLFIRSIEAFDEELGAFIDAVRP